MDSEAIRYSRRLRWTFSTSLNPGKLKLAKNSHYMAIVLINNSTPYNYSILIYSSFKSGSSIIIFFPSDLKLKDLFLRYERIKFE